MKLEDLQYILDRFNLTRPDEFHCAAKGCVRENGNYDILLTLICTVSPEVQASRRVEDIQIQMLQSYIDMMKRHCVE